MSIDWSNVTSPEQLLAVPNSTTGGSFWLVINFLVWVVLLIVFQAFGFEVALLSASFSGLVISLFLSYLGLIAWEWSLFFIGILIFTILYIVYSSNKDQ